MVPPARTPLFEKKNKNIKHSVWKAYMECKTTQSCPDSNHQSLRHGHRCGPRVEDCMIRHASRVIGQMQTQSSSYYPNKSFLAGQELHKRNPTIRRSLFVQKPLDPFGNSSERTRGTKYVSVHRRWQSNNLKEAFSMLNPKRIIWITRRCHFTCLFIKTRADLCDVMNIYVHQCYNEDELAGAVPES